ncbi:hypothetical protein [Winogradskyella sp.]|uniref:hypothetical protein n=1 Tax=Winogradskyella sp. TaxID=1883156 RepID=UPI0026227C91|nr:hypothetical protein [Winogradskyella sp.]
MKKPLILLILTLGLFACSNDQNEINNEEQNINFEAQAKDLFCGPTHHLEITFFEELLLFAAGGAKKGTCKKKSFGFCFAANLNISFECVPNSPEISARLQNVSYDKITQETIAIGISDPSQSQITIYFDRDIVNSQNHIPSDFDTLDVGKDFYVTNKIKLIEGSYSKIADGDFFKYIVPYEDKN